MTAKRRRLNASVAALARKLQKRHESIWNWSERRPGEIDVLLGPPPRRSPEEEFWGASGRSLLFRKINGRWVLAGQGCWRT